MIAAALVFFGCEGPSLYEAAASAKEPESLELSPGAITLVQNGGILFTVSGGISPYSFDVASGGGTVTNDGDYTAPSSIGTAVVRVTDADGRTDQATVTVTTGGALTIVPGSITLSTNYFFPFTAIGGSPPYTFSKTAGSGSVDPVSGEYTAPGSAGSATIRVTDAALATDDAAVTVQEGLVILPMTVTLPANNNQAFSASGGVAPYTFSMHSGAGSVTVGGFYTAPGAAGTDEVKVTDNVGSTAIATVTVTAPQALNIIPSSYIVLVNDTHTFIASGGVPPYTFSRVSGSGSVTADGDYTAPATPGVDVIRVTDSTAPTPLTSDAVVTVVSFGVLTISPSSVTVEQNTSHQFTTSGGTPLYSYSVVSGSGFVNSSTGEYTAPTALGTETVRVTDAALDTDDATISVAPAAPTGLDVDGTVPGPQDIQLDWTDNATGEDGFKIERKVSGGAYAQIDTVGPNVTTYTDTGLSPNIPYAYRVRAYTGTVNSGYSNEDFDIPNS